MRRSNHRRIPIDFACRRVTPGALVVLLLLDLVACAHGRARPADPIATDRPDFTESAFVVPAGYVQLETGYSVERSGARRVQTVGEGLLRVALSEVVELRVGLNSFAVTRSAASREHGFEDQSLGVKVKLLTPDEAASPFVPDMALIGAATLPGPGGPFREGTIQPEVRLAAAWSILPRIDVAANAALASATADGQRYGGQALSAAAGFELTNRAALYAEYFGFTAAPREGFAHWVDAGLAYQVTPNLQLDVRAGRQMGGLLPTHVWGVGLSSRW